jgi:4-hydroxybenzoate polyprenyltransferase
MRCDASSLAGFLAVFCFFLHLRLFDDHKDYEEDCRHYPERALSRGAVTLADLKMLAALAIGLEFGLSALCGGAALLAVAAAFAFSLLMLKEFFARDWLKRHYLLYAWSHMLIIPLLSLAIFSFATARSLWEAPGWYWIYSVVGFCTAFHWEISRKIRAPEQEIEGVDSYSKRFGVHGAACVLLLLRVVDTGLVAAAGLHLRLGIWLLAVIVILFGVCTVGFLQYCLHTTPATARRMEACSRLHLFALNATVAVELARTRGIDFFGWT